MNITESLKNIESLVITESHENHMKNGIERLSKSMETSNSSDASQTQIVSLTQQLSTAQLRIQNLEQEVEQSHLMKEELLTQQMTTFKADFDKKMQIIAVEKQTALEEQQKHFQLQLLEKECQWTEANEKSIQAMEEELNLKIRQLVRSFPL